MPTFQPNFPPKLRLAATALVLCAGTTLAGIGLRSLIAGQPEQASSPPLHSPSHAAGGHDAHHGHHASTNAAKPRAFAQSLLRLAPSAPLALPTLQQASGAAFGPAALGGRWQLVFFGYSACPDVCPLTLKTLSEFAARPDSGMPGKIGIVFVSVDPERDTPARLREYLAHFDARILGLTGQPAAIRAFSEAFGAGAGDQGPVDHATSIFVLDPQSRLRGVLLRPDDPARIAADLASLQQNP